jgi:hypothetical protein
LLFTPKKHRKKTILPILPILPIVFIVSIQSVLISFFNGSMTKCAEDSHGLGTLGSRAQEGVEWAQQAASGLIHPGLQRPKTFKGHGMPRQHSEDIMNYDMFIEYW